MKPTMTMTTLALLVAALPLAGCQRTREQVKQDVEQASEEAQAGMEKAAEAVGEGVEKAGEAMQEAGAEAQAGMEKAAEALDDAGITAKVKAKLIADPEVAGLQINVDTKDGVVTLTGNAGSQALKDEAEKLARGTEGVKDVKNEIQVTGEAG